MKKNLLLALTFVLLTTTHLGAATRTVTFKWQQDLNRAVVFSWEAAENASRYQLRVHEEGTPYDPCSAMSFCGDVAGLSQSVVLKPGTNYDWWVAGVNADGVIGPPVGSSFTTVAFGGWKLYRAAQSGGPYDLIATIPFIDPRTEYQSSQNIIVPDGLTTTLYFVLTAFNSVGESPRSGEVSATIDLRPPVPGPPGKLGAGDVTIPITPFTLEITVTTP